MNNFSFVHLWIAIPFWNQGVLESFRFQALGSEHFE